MCARRPELLHGSSWSFSSLKRRAKQLFRTAARAGAGVSSPDVSHHLLFDAPPPLRDHLVYTSALPPSLRPPVDFASAPLYCWCPKGNFFDFFIHLCWRLPWWLAVCKEFFSRKR
uniref:Uncharacterized protein n=1 Tax=Plectus sambesii TaxID=2011161 RepID=A0A914VQE9_9BILA